ncbi:Double-strand-break repair protein rad21 [Globisporangium polare]
MGCSQSTPVQEPVASAAPASAPRSNASAAAPPASNASKTSEAGVSAAVAPVSAAKKLFTVSGVSITEQGVVFYHVEAADGSLSLQKRYNDFKALYTQLANSSLLPPLPKANLGTLFKGKHNQELIREREEQFELVLNAIASNAAFADADVFKTFLSA